jgi:lysophospholipase L1-like esterase
MRVPLAFVLVFVGSFATAQNGEHWVATWAASPQPPRPLPGPPGAQPPAITFKNQTIRMIVHTSIGGRRVRVEFSNAHGSAPLAVGAAHIAIRGKDSGVVPGSDRALSFSGQSTGNIPPGAMIVSDPVDLDVPRMGDLAISVYVPSDTGQPTTHATGLHTTYISKEGDFTGQAALTDTSTTQSWYWLSSVDVLAPADAAAIVAFGDSITDGTRSTPDANHNWPSFLAARILSTTGMANLAIVDQGIAGNRILRDGIGTNALARFDRDVLTQPGVKWMTVLEGINDIGQSTREGTPPAEAVPASDLIAGLRQMIERAHTHGIKVIGCTLTPYEGAAYYSEAGEEIRQAVNRWIRTGGAFDAVVDFDAATRDPDNLKRIRPEFDSSDHLHPNDAGYKAMADSIDLSIFRGQGSKGGAQ